VASRMVKCPKCGKEVDKCPYCGHPVKIRKGLRIPQSQVLFELPLTRGQKYVRSYMVAFLPPKDGLELRLLIGENESPIEYFSDKTYWYNPYAIPLTDRGVKALRTINQIQLSAEVAFRSLLKNQPGEFSLNYILQNILGSRKSILELGRRFYLLMK